MNVVVFLQINRTNGGWDMQKGKKDKGAQYVVIMAGGSGKRLWPESRSRKPKQFQCLVRKDQTLLQETHARVKDLVPAGHVFVSTITEYAEIVREQLPDILPENIIIEPCGRDTAPALAFVADHINRLNTEAIILTVPSDHTVKEVGLFAGVVNTMFHVVRFHPERIGLIGIKTTEASTALGYIKMGNEMRQKFSHAVYQVASFAEKPSEEKAKEYFNDWQYLWNSGCFVFCASTLLDQVRAHAPEITQVLVRMRDVSDPGMRHDLFATLPSKPIDTTVWEKLADTDLFVVPANLTWSDVGNWRSLHDFHRSDDLQQNYFRGTVVDIDTTNSFIFGDKETVIATLGLDGIVVVKSGGVIFVADRKRVEDVKVVVAKIQKQGLDGLL